MKELWMEIPGEQYVKKVKEEIVKDATIVM